MITWARPGYFVASEYKQKQAEDKERLFKLDFDAADKVREKTELAELFDAFDREVGMGFDYFYDKTKKYFKKETAAMFFLSLINFKSELTFF